MNTLVVGFVIVFMALCVIGCTELKKDLPPTGGTLAVHRSGWTDSTSSNFHGTAIRNANWDMMSCQTCHGSKYDGGIVNVSCRTCHNQSAGPEHCTTCHGSSNNAAPPRDIDGNISTTFRGVGAHQKHLIGGSISDGVACSECHSVPPSVYTPGHVDSPLPAEVPMEGYVATTVSNESTTVDWDSSLAVFTPLPSYSPVSATCSNTYCHGNFKNGNTSFAPVWNDATGTQAACGTCHGDTSRATLAERARPKTAAEGGTHPSSTACSACHGDVVNASLSFVNKSKHINGKLNVFGQERDF
ncbi:MAG: CxxxxCH/CxxCH domain-containing protein [Ignavibacteriae bacterium]|nr:CxxxxCH/CxxCH domain-containing protein [Ignavibacteriota bacterium]